MWGSGEERSYTSSFGQFISKTRIMYRQKGCRPLIGMTNEVNEVGRHKYLVVRSRPVDAFSAKSGDLDGPTDPIIDCFY